MPPKAGEAGGEREREVGFDVAAPPAAAAFAPNFIKTSKYEWHNFVPKNLLEQLHKFGNVYFLCISIVMYLGEKTPLFVGTIKAFSTLGTLLMMMSVTAAMALYDDLRRKAADAEINGAKATEVPRGSTAPQTKKWADVRVGDILVIRKDEEFPADVVPLFCSGEDGNCFVSTANLDGETNLKLKGATGLTQKKLSGGSSPDDAIGKLNSISGAKVVAEPPCANIHDFSGRLEFGGGSESLGLKQLLMRGTVLRNTALCIGLVVYTGADTRMVRNSRPAPMKQSNLERTTNSSMLVLLVVQAVVSLVSAILHGSMSESLKHHWYLVPPVIILPEFFGWWLTFFTLYSNLMPISLYPTIEFCNAFQSYFIANDKNMVFQKKGFNSDAEFHAIARSSNLCQELGQVSYIFSDKTGTLTQNDMALKRLSIAGKAYGTFDASSGAGFNGAGKVLEARSGSDAEQVDAFLEALAVSHTVMATTNSKGVREYEAESPDEFALVSGAAELGWEFVERRGSDVRIRVAGGGARDAGCGCAGPPEPNGNKDVDYKVLATNAFNSTRKRMSVVVEQQSTKKIMLLVKGADNVMLERATGTHKELEAHLKEFSVQGLRTLVIGSRVLEPSVLAKFQQQYDDAQRATSDREKKLMDVAEELEKDLTILGATAIEDKLQDDVGRTIEMVREAGIKLWVLTGDKLETARNIGFSTKVLTTAMEIAIVDVDPSEGGSMEIAAWEEKLTARPLEERAMMVTGQALQSLLKTEAEKKRILSIADKCAVLIACRVSPKQKAEMVALVREHVPGTPITLAIGDGANDVPMIQEAHVGVGIAGVEGRQAVNNSDFAIAQFRFLQRLLFDHGRSNYRRASTYTLFTFWRNMVQVLMMVYYTPVSGFSGTALFEDWIRLSFNFLCTLPILAVGCMDEDVPKEVALAKPHLYNYGRLNKDLNNDTTIATVFSAVAHSLLLSGLALLAFNSFDCKGAGDYYTFGTTAYTCLVIDVNMQALFRGHTHNKFTIGSVVASFLLYAFWLLFYPMNPLVVNLLAPNMYMVPEHMVKNGYFWLLIIAVPILSIMMDAVVMFVSRTIYVDSVDEVMSEMTKVAPDTTQVKLLSEFSPIRSALLDDSSDREAAERLLPGRFPLPACTSVDMSPLGQRELPTVRFGFKRRSVSVVFCGVLAAVVLCVMGGIALHFSAAASQVLVTYSKTEQAANWWETPWLAPGYGTTSEESFECTLSAAGSCEVPVKLPANMTNPWIFYLVGPFYQSHSAYLRSEVVPELHGKEVPEKLRETLCVESTRVTDDGEDIVPCGMKATSLFNDTFAVRQGGSDLEIDYSVSAWRSDVSRYNNPEDYLQRSLTSWLPDRYQEPAVFEDLGVKSEHFVDWMRPSALPRVWNRYGSINGTFEKGTTLTISIQSNYPVQGIPGSLKRVLLTEMNEMGGRHSGFGLGLIVSGVLCGLIALAVIPFVLCGK